MKECMACYNQGSLSIEDEQGFEFFVNCPVCTPPFTRKPGRPDPITLAIACIDGAALNKSARSA